MRGNVFFFFFFFGVCCLRTGKRFESYLFCVTYFDFFFFFSEFQQLKIAQQTHTAKVTHTGNSTQPHALQKALEVGTQSNKTQQKQK